jgi:hypothetical protein
MKAVADRRVILPAVALLIIAVTCITVVWFTVSHILNRAWMADMSGSSLALSLADFRFDHPRRSQLSRQKDNEIFSTDVLCGGCYHKIANAGENLRCGRLLYDTMQKEHIPLQEAAVQIATSDAYREPCARCLPTACSDEEKKFWRYDSKEHIPRILASTITTLQSIPFAHRIPAHAVKNLTAFFSLPDHAVPAAKYFFDYNPSIVVLPRDFFSQGMFPIEDPPLYVASYRVSTQQSCFHPYETKAMYGGTWDAKPPVQDYLAIALLRSELSVILDAVLDIKGSRVFQQFAEDFRLFVFQKQLYVASFDLIAPLWITTRDSSISMKENFVELNNVFPSNLKAAIRQFPSCPVCHNRSNKRCGKNHNYFSSDDVSDPKINHPVALVEIWPSGPHVVQQVDLNRPCSAARAASEDSSAKSVFSDSHQLPPLPSWHTMEEVMFPDMIPSETILTRGRGGACCISIQDPRTGKLLRVGVYHTKIPKLSKRSGSKIPQWFRASKHNNATTVIPNQYFSRWYAFEPRPPYSVVGQSGLFCLGYPAPYEWDSQPLIKTTLWKKIVFGGDGLDYSQDSLVLDCPRIHFISGMTEKAEDSSKVIIAYGINDCVSRLIEVEKAAIAGLLFPSNLSKETAEPNF